MKAPECFPFDDEDVNDGDDDENSDVMEAFLEDNFHRTLMPLMPRGSPLLGVGGGIEESRASLNRLCFVAPCASLIGSVRVGSQSSIWYGAVLRAEACDNRMSTNGKRNKDWETKWLEMSDEVRKAENQRSNGSEINGGMIVIGEGTNVQKGVIVRCACNSPHFGNRVCSCSHSTC